MDGGNLVRTLPNISTQYLGLILYLELNTPKIKKHITEQLALNDLQKNENLMPLFLVISGQKPVAIWLKVWLGLE